MDQWKIVCRHCKHSNSYQNEKCESCGAYLEFILEEQLALAPAPTLDASKICVNVEVPSTFAVVNLRSNELKFFTSEADAKNFVHTNVEFVRAEGWDR